MTLREAHHAPLKPDIVTEEQVVTPRKVKTTRAITVKKPVAPLSRREAQKAKKDGTAPNNTETKLEEVEETVNDV